MDISLGFVIAFIFILLPGLIFRRLYYYGEFSKQFSSGFSLIKLIAACIIPGTINLLGIYYFYNNFITPFSIEDLVNTFKNLNNPEYHLSDNDSTLIKKIKDDLLPFIYFIYTSSIICGALLGRLVRITRIDTKTKLLRFKNYWFYAFSGELTRFKEMRHMQEINKKHLFTLADILIDGDGKTILYSGVVVDYEIGENDCQMLNKIVLQNAERYKIINGQRIRVNIPGNLLVVDCCKMRNINLTYVYEESKTFLESKIPAIIDNFFSLIIILIIPAFVFKTEFIKWDWYVGYFNKAWYLKPLLYLFCIQILAFLNPFLKRKDNSEYEYVGIKIAFYKLLITAFLYFVIWIID